MKLDDFGRGMTLIVKTIARLTGGLILLFGIYVVIEGHSSPGGGFAGGVVIALAFIHLILAFGKESVRWYFSRSVASLMPRFDAPLVMSLAMLGFLGLWFVHSFLAQRGHWVRPYDELVAQLCHLFIGVNVGAGLFTIFVCLVGFAVRGGGER